MPMAPVLHVRRLRDDAVVPAYMTADAAGLDLAAAIDAPIELAPGARAAIGTGLALAIPRGFEGQVRPRSGLAKNHGDRKSTRLNSSHRLTSRMPSSA